MAAYLLFAFVLDPAFAFDKAVEKVENSLSRLLTFFKRFLHKYQGRRPVGFGICGIFLTENMRIFVLFPNSEEKREKAKGFYKVSWPL